MRTQKLSPSDLKTHIRHPNTLLPASCQPPCQASCVKQQPTFHCRCRGSGEWNCGIVNGGIYPHCTWLFINSILCEFALWMQNDNFADITSQLHKNSNVTQQWLRLWKLFLCKNCKNVRKDFTITEKAANMAFSCLRAVTKMILLLLRHYGI